MSIKSSLTRRQALFLSGSAAAGFALGGLPRWARGAPSAPPALPIPRLIQARNGEPVALVLQKTQHRFGSGPAVPSRGISSSYLGPVVRVRSGDTIPFRVETISTRRRRCTGTACSFPPTSTVVCTIRSGRAACGRPRSRSGSRRPRPGSIRTRTGLPPGRCIRVLPA